MEDDRRTNLVQCAEIGIAFNEKPNSIEVAILCSIAQSGGIVLQTRLSVICRRHHCLTTLSVSLGPVIEIFVGN